MDTTCEIHNIDPVSRCPISPERGETKLSILIQLKDEHYKMVNFLQFSLFHIPYTHSIPALFFYSYMLSDTAHVNDQFSKVFKLFKQCK